MAKHNHFTHIQNFLPSKKMGQNFLTDNNIAQNIVNLINVNEYDLVIEIGPGTGALTQYLVQFNHRVVAIELDKRLGIQLKNKFKNYPNLEIINNDILKIDLAKLAHSYHKVALVSNLPYSISTPMMLHFLKQNKIMIFYCMLQRELVDRLLAKPSTKNYGSISVLIQFYTMVSKLLNAPPQSFTPIPKVDSNVIVLKKLDKIFDEKWSQFIRQCFAYKRKTLINNLKSFYPIKHLQTQLHKLDLNLSVRSEQLSVDILFQLYQGLSKYAST